MEKHVPPIVATYRAHDFRDHGITNGVGGHWLIKTESIVKNGILQNWPLSDWNSGSVWERIKFLSRWSIPMRVANAGHHLRVITQTLQPSSQACWRRSQQSRQNTMKLVSPSKILSWAFESFQVTSRYQVICCTANVAKVKSTGKV